MKLTPKDTEMFRTLGQSELGKQLLDYFKRVQDHAYDSRSWEKDDSKESASQAARLIEKCLVEKIRPKHNSEPIVGEFE